MNKKKVSFGLFISLFLLLRCSSGLERQIEEVQFLLDDGKYSEAVDKARLAVSNDPENVDARLLLASALLGDALLSGGKGCDETDTGFLGLVACLQDQQSEGETDFITFSRVAPDVNDQVAKLEEARDTLITLTGEAQGAELRDVFLKLYFARLFEISGAVTRLGANSDNEICNSSPDSAFKDDVPDSFLANALSADQVSRFQDNLENVNDDGQSAGLPDDFSLNERITSILVDLTSSINAAGDNATGAANFFDDQFNSADKALCTVSK